MSESAGRPLGYSCACRFVAKDEFTAGVLLSDTLCGYHAAKERELADCLAELEGKDACIRVRVQEINERDKRIKALEALQPESRLTAHAEREVGSFPPIVPEKCVYPEECKAYGYCIRPGDHDKPEPCAPSPAGPDALAEELEVEAKLWESHAGQKWADLCRRAATALRSRPAQDRDAERYRWLRKNGGTMKFRYLQGFNLDDNIDAAMSQQEPK